MASPLRIGIVGVGNISGIYLQNLGRYASTEIVAVADLDEARAKDVADRNGIPTSSSPDQLLANPDVELVLNLTIPKAHGTVAIAALEAGKHVYNEKPLAVSREDGRRMVEIAKEKGLRVGGAPDTFLGGAHQTARRAIDAGMIGEPVAAQAFMMGRGHESWHPSPEFYYEKGGGPMFDMGPYYLTALVNMIGGVSRVTGSARITFPTRTITSQPKHGKVIDVETPTHISGVMDFSNGAVGEMTQSFDVYHSPMPPIVIYGSEGTLLVPDPNGFGGEVKVRGAKDDDWSVVENLHAYNGNDRGIGVLDIADAIRTGRPHRASGELAYHVLDLMHAFHDASAEERHVQVSSAVERPEAMPVEGLPGEA
ncbi:Gfo/Idh/MocA family oxidoreductase [bacterium]|nr:MAG: Gfo/Idh/MocA family oxidoreductase [bacterium]